MTQETSKSPEATFDDKVRDALQVILYREFLNGGVEPTHRNGGAAHPLSECGRRGCFREGK